MADGYGQGYFSNPNTVTTLSNNVIPVKLPTGDCFVFYSDKKGAKRNFKVLNKDDSIIIEQDPVLVPYRLSLGSNVLYGGLVPSSHSEKSPQMKWVGFMQKKQEEYEANGETIKVCPLVEVYSPSVYYDEKTNVINLFFWTNMDVRGTEGKGWWDYHIKNMAVFYGSDYGFDIPTSTGWYSNIDKVLYHATGFFKKVVNLDASMEHVDLLDKDGEFIAVGKAIKDSDQKVIDAVALESNKSYYMPLFNKPVPINIPQKIDNDHYECDKILDAVPSYGSGREFDIESIRLTKGTGSASTADIIFKNIWYQKGMALIMKSDETRITLNKSMAEGVPLTVIALIDMISGDVSIDEMGNKDYQDILDEGFFIKYLYEFELVETSVVMQKDLRGVAINVPL
jgi:hypothetical protein